MCGLPILNVRSSELSSAQEYVYLNRYCTTSLAGNLIFFRENLKNILPFTFSPLLYFSSISPPPSPLRGPWMYMSAADPFRGKTDQDPAPDQT